MVCFDSKKRLFMEGAMDKKESISVNNCEVKKTHGGKQELVASNTTYFKLRPDKEFDVNTEVLTEYNGKFLESITAVDNISLNKLVDIKVKVVHVNDSTTVTTNDGRIVNKQECYCRWFWEDTTCVMGKVYCPS